MKKAIKICAWPVALAICVGWMVGCSSKKESDSTPQWVERLNEIELPDYMQGDSLINVYFKYNLTVNWYVITGRWMPYDKYSETGKVVINIRNKVARTEFQYFSDKYNSFDTDEVTFAKDFKGHQNGDIHYFEFTYPQYKEHNDNSSIVYYPPFQFLDVDFDGNDELLISEKAKGKASDYVVYALTYKGLQGLNYTPLDGYTVGIINLENTNTIQIVHSCGANDVARFFFLRKKRQEAIKDVPKFISASASSFDFDIYNQELGSSFVLDSIVENTEMDAERCVTYKVSGSKIIVMSSDNSVENVEQEYDFPSQSELNMEWYNYRLNHYKSVEKEYQKLLANYPEYEELFEKEKTAWRQYYDAVNKTAEFGSYGTSKPMRVNDIVDQSIKLREVSIHNLQLFSQGSPVWFCKTIFKIAMTEQAYAAFIDAAGSMDVMGKEDTEQLRKLLREEQKWWNNWMYCREMISRELPDDIRRCYDNCTNMVKRTKLYQLKNQNEGLGITSGEVIECTLSEDCSDKELLEYPGFNVVWANH